MLVVFSFFLGACNRNKVPNDVIQPEKMENFLYEAYLLEGFYAIESGFHYELMAPQIIGSYDSLLYKYEMTREDFEHSMDFYTHHPRIYEKIHQNVIARFDEELAE